MPPLSEADTCRKYVVPKLQAAGWDDEPHSIAEQRSITDGRIVPVGKGFVRKPPRRVDYLLRYERSFPLAVVEAKGAWRTAGEGLQQAKEYAEMLGLKFAYATNGEEIIEFDYFTGRESIVTDYPTPGQLWARYRRGNEIPNEAAAQRLLTPINHASGKGERYYQEIAINRAVEGILKGDRRQLLTMATGTGKTAVAFQICWKLWNARWNRSGEYRKPRILYLADRNILVDDPKDKDFAPFGDARHKIEGGEVVKGREMYFAIYQSLARDERRPGLYREFGPDFFDLIIVDECHRGSARDDSNWREILTYFEPAYQLGMTATPLRADNRDTYLYFGNPIYQYSLRQGIEDGFLAPYRVHRVITEWDAAGWRPSQDELDRYGRSIPDEQYQTNDFERIVALKARTEAIARHLTEFMKKHDRFAKTIVFCVDQEHADEMRRALNNLNSDLVKQFPDYVCRVTADEGDIGRGHLGRFQDVESRTPVILTSSQLLTTGVDAPTCKNVVLARVVNSMIPLPPIAEQQRIVARIEELAAKIDEARALRMKAAEEAQSILASATNAVLSGAGLNHWTTKPLEDVAEIRSGVTLGRQLFGQTIRLPYLRVANVQDGHLDLAEIKEVDVLKSECDKWKLQRGDLLLTEGGDWDKLGRGTIWHDEIPNCIHQNHIFRVRVRTEYVIPEFLAKLIASPVGKAYFQGASKQTTNLASINQRQLKAFKVVHPPLSEQRRIVAELDAVQVQVDALKRLQSETAAELNALLPAILDRAFKGEL